MTRRQLIRQRHHAARPLTDRQAALLLAIASYTATHGYAPTIRELTVELGIKPTSHAAISDHLERLRANGAVTWERGKSRTLRVVSQP